MLRLSTGQCDPETLNVCPIQVAVLGFPIAMGHSNETGFCFGFVAQVRLRFMFLLLLFVYLWNFRPLPVRNVLSKVALQGNNRLGL